MHAEEVVKLILNYGSEPKGLVRLLPTRAERSKAASDLAKWSSLFAYLAEYLENRGGGDFEDQGHEAAVAAANKRLKRVRKALGYTSP